MRMIKNCSLGFSAEKCFYLHTSDDFGPCFVRDCFAFNRILWWKKFDVLGNQVHVYCYRSSRIRLNTVFPLHSSNKGRRPYAHIDIHVRCMEQSHLQPKELQILWWPKISNSPLLKSLLLSSQCAKSCSHPRRLCFIDHHTYTSSSHYHAEEIISTNCFNARSYIHSYLIDRRYSVIESSYMVDK